METLRCMYLCAVLLGLVSAQCRNKRTCGECIQEGCKWCADPELEDVYRCYSRNDSVKCQEEHLHPQKFEKTLQVDKDDSFGMNVLFRPQKVRLNLHVGEEYELLMKYKHARNYPVDLYYLMDLSYSMKDDKISLSQLGSRLASEMKAITSDFRLGFGSFVDKIEWPFVNTIPAKLEKPCDSNCVSPYGFRNHLSLDNNTSLFEMKVDEAQVSASLDTPEGGFDALVQAIVCTKQIGWRKKARHLLVFSTDAESHFAGDGKLAGLVEPNDLQCHVTEDGMYKDTTMFDYPSIGQINRLVEEHNINVIFAVTATVEDIYKRLLGRIKGSSVGVLDSSSTNVVDIVRGEYQKIVDSLTLTTTADPKYFLVTFWSRCKGEWKETQTCGELHQGDEVSFKVVIKVLKCPADGKARLQFNPVALEDHVDVEVSVPCSSCSCEDKVVSRSPKCSGHGDLECGICNCYTDRYGDICQCKKNNNYTSNQADLTANCRLNKGPICSDVGVCRCGTCTCNERDDPSERYSGPYCECDNFTCLRYAGSLCSGPDHGTCKCGVCECNPGWSGDACQCAVDKETCFLPGSNLECSGQGKCVCGICQCDKIDGVQYYGRYCQNCPTCQSQQCAQYSDLVECHVFNSGILKPECPQYNFTLSKVDVVKEPEEVDETIRVCRAQSEDGCYFYFRYVIDDDLVEVQEDKDCPKQVNIIALVAGLVGGIVLLGLLFLISWKIVTTVHDGREFAKFEEERKKAYFDKTGNPLYQDPVIKYTNPTFRD